MKVIGKTSIETITSDHAHITVGIKIGEEQNKVNIWRLNDALIHDSEIRIKRKKWNNTLINRHRMLLKLRYGKLVRLISGVS